MLRLLCLMLRYHLLNLFFQLHLNEVASDARSKSIYHRLIHLRLLCGHKIEFVFTRIQMDDIILARFQVADERLEAEKVAVRIHINVDFDAVG